MNSDHRHSRTGSPVDPLIAAPSADGPISPSDIPPVPPPPDIPPTAGVAELRQLLIEFSQSTYKAVAAIPGALRSLDGRTGLLRRILIAFLVTLVLDIAGTAVVGLFVHKQGVTQAQLAKTQAQLVTTQSQLTRVIRGNCYLLGLVIPNYHGGSSPQRTSYAGGPTAYDNLYIGMQGWSDELQCGIKHSVPGT